MKCIDDEIPFEIPEGWEWARINTIGISQLGKTLDRGKNFGKEYPYLCSINVYWDGIDLSKIKTFKLRDDELARYKLQKGDLLICEGGDYGRCCIWDRDEDMYYQNALHRVRFYGGLISYFYKYVFELYRNIGYVVGQGQTIKHFTYESMKSILFPVPSISEQKRIVSRIEEIKPIVKKYGRTEETLKQLNEDVFDKLKKSVLQEAIQGRLVTQDPNDEPASVLLERIREEKQRLLKEGKLKKKDINDSIIFKGDDNKYYERINGKLLDVSEEIPFDIPDSWRWARIKALFQTTSGGTPEKGHPEYYGGDIPWVKVGDLTDIYLAEASETISQSGYQNSSAKLFPVGTILVAMYCNDAIGKSSILTNPMTTNQAICGLYPNVHLCKEYIYYAIQANKGRLQEQAAGGAQKNINQKIVNELLLPIPPREEQDRIVNRIRDINNCL